MLDRKKVIEQAFRDCIKEMYAKAQPPADYDTLIELVKNGVINESETPIYQRYYLSQQEFIYIRDKYIKAYGLESHWQSDIEVLEKYLREGGTKDVWKDGRREYAKVAPIIEQLTSVLNYEDAKKVNSLIFSNIENCKNFYRFDREESDFSCSVALGASPISNPQAVVDYWKSQGIDIVIEERNPLLFWERDYYGDNFEEVMENEYGPDWEIIWKYKLKVNERKSDKGI